MEENVKETVKETAKEKDTKNKSVLIPKSLEKSLMHLALSLFAKRVDCVRVEELFYYSNAMFGFVYEPFSGFQKLLVDFGFAEKPLEAKTESNQNDTKDGSCKKEVSDLIEAVREKINSKHVLTAFGAVLVLKKSASLAGENFLLDKSFISNLFWSKLCVIAEVLKGRLSLESRSLQNTVKEESECISSLNKFNESFCRGILSSFEDFKAEETEKCCDLLDGRFLVKLAFIDGGKESSLEDLLASEKDLLEEIESIWKSLEGFEGLKFMSGVELFPLNVSEDTNCDSCLEKCHSKKGIQTYSIHKIASETKDVLTEEIDGILNKEDLIYREVGELEKEIEAKKQKEEMFICDALELSMRELDNNKVVKIKDKNEKSRESKNKSKFYAFMKKYSQSLAQPKIVLRDVVVANNKDPTKEAEKEVESPKGKKNKSKKGKKQKNDRREIIMQQNKEKQTKKAKANMIIFIEQALKPLRIEEKIRRLDERLLPIKDPIIALPGQIQLLEWLKELYKQRDLKTDKEPATQLFRNVYDIYRRFKWHLSLQQFNKLQSALLLMGFIKENKKLVEDFNTLKGKAIAKIIDFSDDIYSEQVSTSCARFQLKHAGHFMVRSINSKEDPRVSGFFPDDWQRNFLDAVDANESCLVVCPTSSGKTFISYYTMKKILNVNKTTDRKNEKNYVVFVCPSKALVNQVSADIYGRYGEIFGVDTLDYNWSVLECEVLVTVPESFEKILLSPPFESFVKRIKYVIMDEIHSIGDPTGGEIWERIILLIQCPFIALSATLGNPQTFHRWLQRVSNPNYALVETKTPPKKSKVNLIEFYERWSDLEKYIYLPENSQTPEMKISDFEKHSGDKPSALFSINPFSAFKLGVCNEENFVMPNLDLSSKDCLEIYDAMMKFVKEKDHSEREVFLAKLRPLEPEKFFKGACITKNEVTLYGKELKSLISTWHKEGKWEEVDKTFEMLSKKLISKIRSVEEETPTETKEQKEEEVLRPLPNVSDKNFDGPYSDDFLVRHLIPLLVEMKNSNDLPAIVFAKSQKLCDKMAVETLKYFESNEKFVLSSNEVKERKKNVKNQIKSAKAWKRERDRIDKRKEEEMMKEGELPSVNIDDEDDNVDYRFSFIGLGELVDEDDIKYWLQRALRKNNWSKGHPFLRCIKRGIAVHHNGMSRAYKTLVEVLFRAKHIKVVLTVGTLALGVNMPCRTTVFAGDSPELTPLRYRQMMGRAGRRGYDNVGKVIFFGIPPQKISYLMTSSLLSLHGHDAMTMTTYLRNLFCVSESRDKAFRINSFKNMMKKTFQSRSHSEIDANRDAEIELQTKLFYRYSMEYLYQNGLVNLKLDPTKLSGLVAHLYPSEPSNFVFAILLENGILHKTCSSIVPSELKSNQKDKEMKQNEKQVCLRLIEILAHIFFRVPLPSSFEKPSRYNTKVVLSPLPSEIREAIERFNSTTVSLYSQFYRLSNLVVKEKDIDSVEKESLPLSQLPFQAKGGNESGLKCKFAELAVSCKARSSFSALSGLNDSFSSGQELLDSVRNFDIDFKKSDSIPVLELKDAAGRDLQLSAYALDFYKQGSLLQIMKENNLPELFAWNQLKNWSLTLRAISHSLAHLSASDEEIGQSEQWKKTCYAFSVLSSSFDGYFKSIVEIIEFNYE